MKLSYLAIGALFLGTTSFAAVDAEFVEKAKAFENLQRQSMIALSEKYKEAVVEVEIVWQIAAEYQGQNQSNEEKAVANGVYVRKDGLIVLSLSRIDPAFAALAQIPEQMRGQIKLTSNAQSAKIRTNDGKEIEADILLKDPELDILYVRPKEALKKEQVIVDFKKSAKTEVLASYYSFGVMEQRYGRAVQHIAGNIMGHITKPKDHFVLTNPVPGMPIFDIFTGKVLGICLSPKAIGRFCLVTCEEILENMEQIDE